MAFDYFYDNQIRRYLQQFVRIFHGFQYEYTLRNGEKALRQIPVRWGDPSRMVSHILRNNSENVINSTPFMTVWIQNMAYAIDRRQQSFHTEKVQVAERVFDEEEQAYTSDIGNRYTVERYMPVPYNMTLQLDIWASNTTQKFQIFEQIAPLFNDSLDIQNGVNPVDWTTISAVHLQDVTWSSRSIPQGTESAIDILSMTFLLPIWISPPAKVKKQAVIHQIIANIGEPDNMENIGVGEGIYFDEGDLLGRVITTPGNHQVRIEGEEITLLSESGSEKNEEGDIFNWELLLNQYAKFRPQITQFRLKKYAPVLDSEDGDIVGTIELHPTEDNKLLWSIDPLTLPINTLDPINAIINPHTAFPGAGLPSAATGQRYLLLTDIGGEDKNAVSGDTAAWGDLLADVNDIIEYNGTTWAVVFDASASPTEEFLINSFTNKQLHWTSSEWTLAVDGEYGPGIWRLYF